MSGETILLGRTVTIISIVLGSSLFVTALTTFYSDYVKQPYIDTYVAFGNTTDKHPLISFFIVNNGLAVARNITIGIAVEMPGEIFAYTKSQISNGITLKDIKIPIGITLHEIQDTMIPAQNTPGQYIGKMYTVNIPRLAPITESGRGLLQVDTYFQKLKPNDAACFSVDAEYNEGKITSLDYCASYPFPANHVISTHKDLFQLFLDFFEKAISPDIWIVVFGVIIIWLIYEITKKIVQKTPEARFVSKMVKDATNVRNIIHHNISSKMIFPFDTWDSKADDFKRKIINCYEDFNIITEFYEKLKIRHSFLISMNFSNQGTTDSLKKDNEECLRASETMLAHIKSIKYRSYDKKSLLVFMTMTIFFVSLIIYNVSRLNASRLPWVG